MKNAFKKIVTLILIVSMMLGVMSTTALAAQDTSTGSSTQSGVEDVVGGGINTDWCDISYDEKGITIVLNANAGAFLGISGSEIKSVLKTLIDAVKSIVINDLKNSMLPSVPETSRPTATVDAKAIFENALNTFIKGEYGSADSENYVKFLKGLMVEGAEDEETVFDRFTSYILGILRTTVNSGEISVSDLPEAETIEDNIAEIFETEIDNRIKAETEKYVLLYIDFLKGAEVVIPDDIKALIDGQVKAYVEAKVQLYMDSGFKAPAEPDDVDTIIADYLNAEIKTQVDTWLNDYADGKTIPQEVKSFVDGKISTWVTEVADSYRDNVTPDSPGPLYDVAYGKISGIIDAKVDEYITDYLKNKEIDTDIATVVDDFLHTEAPEIIYDTYWQYKDANNSLLSKTGTLWNTIHTEVRTNAADAIYRLNAATMANIDAAYTYFDTKSSSEIKAVLGADFDTEAIDTVATEISAYTQAEWVDVWNDLSADSQAEMRLEVNYSIKNSDSFKSTVHGLIVGYWVADSNATQDEKNKVESNKRTAVAELLALSNYDSVLETLISDAKANYSSLIEDELSDYLGDNTIKTLSNVIKGIQNSDSLEIITEKIKAEANTRFNDIKAEAFVSILQKTEAEVNARVEKCTKDFLEAYEALVAELKAAEEKGELGGGLTVTDVFSHVQKISVGDTVLYVNDAVSLNALIDFVFTLPTFDEIKDMSNAEMKLDYVISIDTDFGTTEFGFVIKVEDGFNEIREYSSLVSEYLTFDMNEDGTIVFDLHIPDKFAELVLRAANSDKVPDELKHKVFSLFTMTPEDAVAFINDTTLDDILKIFDYVDFDGLLGATAIGNTAGLSSAQIKAKIKQYEGYYNKLISLINSLYNKLPESMRDTKITNFYLGDGELGSVGSYSVNVKELLTKFGSQYATLISSFIADEKINLSFDVSVKFDGIRRIDYVIEGETYASGFLPVGADVVYFANILEYKHFPVIKWVDAEKTEYTTMPDRDITLYADLDKKAGMTATLPEKLECVYTGEDVAIELDLTTGALAEGAVLKYSWYKDGALVEGETGDTLNVKYVADSGKYYCEVRLFIGDELYGIVKTNECTVTVAKAKINLEDYHWSNEKLVYNGEMQYVYLVDKDGNKLTFGATYVDNGAINAGEYTAKVTFDTDNFEIIGTVNEFKWEIDKATYDMSGVSFDDKEVDYNGTVQGITITGTLPNGVTEEYSTVGYINPGLYTITVSFSGDYNNYHEIPDMSAQLRIWNVIKDLAAYESDGKLIVGISSVDGISERYKVNVKDVATQYAYVTSEDIFGAGKVGYVVSAYDIYFTDGGTVAPQNGQFTVRILMPQSLANTPDELIRLVYIEENGSVQDMQGTRQGDYIVFNTTHFSVYAIVEIGDAPVVPVIKDYSWIWKLVVAIVLVLLVALVIIIVIIKKRKNKGGDDTTGKTSPTPAPVPPTEEPKAEETVEPVEKVAIEEAAEEAPVEEPSPEAAVEEPAAEPVEPVKPLVVLSPFDENGEPRVIEGDMVQVRYRTSFMSRLIQAEAPIQDYYTVVKNALLSYKGVKARTSWNFESFNCGRLQCAKLNVKGSAFQVYLGLDPNEYNANKYHFVDVGDKPKLDKVPMLIKVKSERGLKYALELIEEMMKKYELEKIEIKPKDYHLPYETTEALAARDLVKVILPSGVTLDEGVNLVKVDVGSMLANTETEEK